MAYISGRTVKPTKAPRPTTTASATTAARKCVQATMPGVGATVTSNPSWDLAADRPTVRTVVTFPANQPGRTGLALLLADLPGLASRIVGDSSITIVRYAD